MPCRLILVRHGHTAANGGQSVMRLCGWTDVPLSEAGMRDAARAAEQLRRAPAIQAVYVSTLKRARDTARHLERSAEVALVLDPDLREIGCGAVDGRSVHDVRASYPEHWERNERQDDDDFRWPGGESYREFRERCVRAALRIATRNPGGCVAVFTHTGVVTQLIGAIRGLPPARWSAYRPKNGSITVLDWEGRDGRLVAFDACAYVHHPTVAAPDPTDGG